MLGGNKSLLFNVEQIFSIAGPVRLILFYDAGQVRDSGESFGCKEDIVEIEQAADATPDRSAPERRAAPIRMRRPRRSGTMVRRQRSAFKTSTGAEMRFFMPVLNVPFRLIFAYNPQRGGVLDNTLQPQKAFQFRFAVGTTF